MKNELENKFGQLIIPEQIYFQFWKDLDGKFIPTKVEFHYATKIFYLQGYSAHFKELKPTDIIPTYVFEFENEGDTHKFIRVVEVHQLMKERVAKKKGE